MSEIIKIKVLSTLTAQKFDLLEINVPKYPTLIKGKLAEEIVVQVVHSLNNVAVIEGNIIKHQFAYTINKDDIKIKIGTIEFYIANDVESGEFVQKINQLRAFNQQINNHNANIISKKNTKTVYFLFGLIFGVLIIFKVLTGIIDYFEQKKLVKEEKQKMIENEKKAAEAIKKDSIYKLSPEYKARRIVEIKDSINAVKEKQKDSINAVKEKQAEEARWNNSKAGRIYKSHPEWSKEDCIRLANRQIWIGMSIYMLKYLRGLPDSANKSDYGYGVSWQWCWFDYSPSCFYDDNNDGIIDSYN
ncbi:MAG: hypothetical protein IPH57_17370 [Saprospiraceae bacterium]|nr:hypothetical protein [Saprospiraceae bacterium]